MAFSQKNRRDEQKTTVSTVTNTNIEGLQGEDAASVLRQFSVSLSEAISGIAATAQAGIAGTTAAGLSSFELRESDEQKEAKTRGWAFAALGVIGVFALWSWFNR